MVGVHPVVLVEVGKVVCVTEECCCAVHAVPEPAIGADLVRELDDVDGVARLLCL